MKITTKSNNINRPYTPPDPRTGLPDIPRWNVHIQHYHRLMRRRGLGARIRLWYYKLPYDVRKRIIAVSWVILILALLALVFALS